MNNPELKQITTNNLALAASWYVYWLRMYEYYNSQVLSSVPLEQQKEVLAQRKNADKEFRQAKIILFKLVDDLTVITQYETIQGA